MGTILQELVAGATEDENVNQDPIQDPVEPQEPVEPTEDPVEPVEPQEPAEPLEPGEYTPNHKFSFMDQEYEFDDKVKSFIKSKEDEDYFRDMFTAQKAHAAYKEFGGVREIGDKLKGYQEIEQSYTGLNQEVNQLQGMLKSGNIEQFREYLGIPKEQLLNWAIAEAKAQQDPNAAAALQQQYQQQQQNFNLQYQHEIMQNNIEQQNIQQRNSELDAGLGSSEVAKAYDNLVGTPGSFRQAVINHGIVNEQQGRDVSIADAIKAVESQFQGLVANQSVGTQQNPQTQVQTQVVNDPSKTVVINQGNQQTIPNLKAGSQTPAKKKFTSLADLKKYAKTLDD